MSGLQQVHLRVSDADTGRPTPVRLRVTDGAGRYYAPFGRLESFATGLGQDVGGQVQIDGQAWAYIDGACEIALPPGRLHVRIAKGPEYRPIETETDLTAGKLALRFTIERWTDLRRDGWHSGDTRVHDLSPHAALLEGQAEDVAAVQLLARLTQRVNANGAVHASVPNLLAFSGQAACLEAPGCVVAVNTENYHPELGSLGLLHCHRVVFPLMFGGPDGREDWTLHDWCGQCHRKNGLVVWTRTEHRCADFALGEPLVDLLQGQIDAFEAAPSDAADFDLCSLWYDLLNLGLRIPLAGASGKNSNARALGSVRTYAHLADGQELNCRNWIEALRAGRTFATAGPLLTFAVDDCPPGAVLSPTADRVRIQATARSLAPFESLEIVHDGAVIAAATTSGDPATAMLEMEAPARGAGWLAARCRGPFGSARLSARQAILAHTSPIYVDVPDRPITPPAALIARFAAELERMITWCQTKARCETPQAHERLLSGFLKARDRLQSLASL